MAHKARLLNLLLSNTLTNDEKKMAENLSYADNLPEILEELFKADVIIIPTVGLPKSLMVGLIQHLNVKATIYPLDTLVLIEASPIATSIRVNDKLLHFIKKLFPTKPGSFKGVLSFCPGVQVDETIHPGTILWQLRGMECISINVKLMDIMLVGVFLDSFTEKAISHSISFRATGQEVILSPKALIEQVEALINNTVSLSSSQISLSTILQEICPHLCNIKAV